MNNIEHFLEGLREQFESPDSEMLSFDSKFKELKTWDSLTRYSIVAFVKDEYDLEVTSDELNYIESPEQLFRFINKKV